MNWWDKRGGWRKKERTPKVPFKVIKVQRTIIPGDEFLFYSEDNEVYEHVKPTPWLEDAIGARPHCYFLGRRAVDGPWELKRYKGRALHW
jgi:hypothetical protein